MYAFYIDLAFVYIRYKTEEGYYYIYVSFSCK